MLITAIAYIVLGMATLPFIYYLIALHSSWRFFRLPSREKASRSDFTPPVSILKPVRGLDPEAYENFASFCRQDYSEYELVFCIGSGDDPALPVIEQLKRDFPGRSIRVLFRSGRTVSNDKVAKLDRLVSEARYEHVVISDSDVRVQPDYLRTVIAPLARPSVGAVTCLYVSTGEKSLIDNLQTVGLISDLYAGILVAWELDGVKFALGQTIVTTRSRLAGFGGYRMLENRPADDLLVGRLIAEQGYEVELLRYPVRTVADYGSMRELFYKRLRWIVVMRHMRPWGHFGLLLTQGLPWSIAAFAIRPTLVVLFSYLGAYFALRLAMTWMIGTWGLKRPFSWKDLPLVLVWDAVAFVMWLSSFLRNTIRWRGGEYYIRDGMLVPASPSSD
ncbi:MAG: glycosyltransferase [Acidobacteriaceae bacterium]|nr:glycosyltransferase [Acidobacteriaceae bacterium]MBV9296229.1 glycosyltransferase [Acidobacteriaceae bacterium]